MWTVIGIVLFLLALLFSIAWHELGHLSFAKLFNVRTTQYMIGFGKTIWSRQAGQNSTPAGSANGFVVPWLEGASPTTSSVLPSSPR